jgi:hypothetical protein
VGAWFILTAFLATLDFFAPLLPHCRFADSAVTAVILVTFSAVLKLVLLPGSTDFAPFRSLPPLLLSYCLRTHFTSTLMELISDHGAVLELVLLSGSADSAFFLFSGALVGITGFTAEVASTEVIRIAGVGTVLECVLSPSSTRLARWSSHYADLASAGKGNDTTTSSIILRQQTIGLPPGYAALASFHRF